MRKPDSAEGKKRDSLMDHGRDDRESGKGRASWALVLAGVLLASVVTGSAAASSEERLINAVVASVDGGPITFFELRRFETHGAKLLPPPERRDRRAVLEAMIRSRMFTKEFERNGIHAEDADVEAYIDNRLLQSGSSRAELTAALEQLGLEWQNYFDRMREEVQRLALINREIRAKVSVTPEEIRRTWESGPEYKTRERVEISDIYLPLPLSGDAEETKAVWAQADEAYHVARRGRFGEAARKYSQGPTADAGGHLGIFDVGALSDVFRKAVRQLDEGEVSRPFEADGAIHLLKVIKKIAPGRIPLEEVRDDIREKLYDELLETRFQRWIREDLKKRHHITVQLDDLAQWIQR